MSAGAPPQRRRLRRSGLVDEVRDAVLADYIETGVVPAGERLPSEAELCERYGVSRVTVRAAMRSLQEAGAVTIRHGFGSTVLPRSVAIVSGLDLLCSVDTFARGDGGSLTTANTTVEELRADAALAETLEVPEGTRVLSIGRSKLHEGAPAGWLLDYVPTGVVDFDVLTEEFEGSVLDVLAAHDELKLDFADCEVVPVMLDPTVAHRMEVEPGVPALYMSEITRSSDGRVLDHGQAWLLPEHFRFCLRRRRPAG